MGYIENNLMNGENILYRARLHWVVFIWPVIWTVAAIVVSNHGGHTAVMLGRLFFLIAILKAISSFINY